MSVNLSKTPVVNLTKSPARLGANQGKFDASQRAQAVIDRPLGGSKTIGEVGH